jgi:hypothetical protein
MGEWYAGNGKKISSWLDLYMEYTKGLEAPTMFHRWAAIAGCGHVLGRRVWNVRFAPGGFTYGIFPGQLMVCLVAASALLRKSTAIDVMGRLLRELKPGTVNLLPARTSPQQLMKSLQPQDETGDPIDGADCTGLILASELGAFFSSEGFLETMATHVTNLNDAPHGRYDPDAGMFRSRTVTLKFITWQQELLNPCVGMLAATTPTGLARELPSQAQTAGLFGRMLCVYQARTDRDPNALVDVPPRAEQRRLVSLEEALLEGLAKMAELSGGYSLSKQARAYAKDWYAAHVREHQATAPGQESGYIGRKMDHGIRVAMVLTAMEAVRQPWPPEHHLVKEGHLRTALAWLRALEPGFERALGEMTMARRTSLADLVLTYLSRPRRRGKWIPRRQLQRRLWYRCQSGPELRAALRSLVEVGKVRERERERGTIEYRVARRAGLQRAQETRQGAPARLPEDG